MSAAIDQGIYETLRDDAGVNAIVAGAVYPEQAAEEVTGPYVVYALGESEKPRSLTGAVLSERHRYMIGCHHDTYDGAQALATAVYEAFGGDQAATRTLGGTPCIVMWDESPMQKRKLPGQDQARQAVELDLIVLVK